MIRVLQIVGSMNVGGIETFLMNVYRKIDREKVQFDFLVSTDKKCEYDDEIYSLGGKIYYVPGRREGILKNRKALKSFFKKHREYKIIHQHVSSLSYIEPLKIATKYKVPIRIVHSRNVNQEGKIHQILHKLNQIKINKYATHYFTISKLAAEWLYGKKQLRKIKYEIIGNGIDVDKYIFNNDIRKKLKEELNIKHKKVIGHVGRFCTQKNHNFLIEIFNEIHKIDSNTVLLLLGEGSLQDEIKRKVNELELENSVVFLGIKTDVYSYMQVMDVFLFPSLYEGLGRVLIEAQAADLPCVASEKVIPEEAKILETYKEVKLDDTNRKWADEVIDSLRYNKRVNRKKEIQSVGFDITDTAEMLQKFYLENYSKY